MLNQFSRTQLLLGPEAMERLAEARVAVFGISGVGGYAVEALVRSGIGALDLIVHLDIIRHDIFHQRNQPVIHKAIPVFMTFL